MSDNTTSSTPIQSGDVVDLFSTSSLGGYAEKHIAPEDLISSGMRRFFSTLPSAATPNRRFWADPKSGVLTLNPKKVINNNFDIGLNICGLEHSMWLTDAELAYYKSKGFTKLRITDDATNYQNTLYGELDFDKTDTFPGHMSMMIQQLQLMQSHGFTVLFEPNHNYGRFYDHVAQKDYVMGDPDFPPDAFGDFWDKVTARINAAGLASMIWAYDLHNEAHDLTAGTDGTSAEVNAQNLQIYMTYMQAGINAVRKNDTQTTIAVEGYHWATAAGAMTFSQGLEKLVDPSDRLIFEFHCYFDHDASGTTGYITPQVALGDQLSPVLDAKGNPTYKKNANGNQVQVFEPLDENIGVKRLQAVIDWKAKTGKNVIIGEYGVGHVNDVNDPYNTLWNKILYNFCQALKENNILSFYFGAGPEFATYYYTIEQQANGSDTRQLSVLEHYLGQEDHPTTYYLTVPTRGIPNEPSPMAVDVNAIISTAFDITLTDGGVGGTFDPPVIHVQPGFNYYQQFTYTPPAKEQNIYISGTNTGGIADPDPILYPHSTYQDMFTHAADEPVNVFATKRIYSPYTGSAIQAYAKSTQTATDVGFESILKDANIKAADLTKAQGTDDALYIQKWYDQSPNKNHMVVTYMTNINSSTGKTVAPSDSDYPQIVPSYDVNGTSTPIALFNGNRMDAPRCYDQAMGLTWFLCAKANDTSGTLRFLLNTALVDQVLMFDSDGATTTLVQNSYDSKNAIVGSWSSKFKSATTPDVLSVYALRFVPGVGWFFYINGEMVSSVTTDPFPRFSNEWGAPYSFGYYRYGWGIPGSCANAYMEAAATYNVGLTENQVRRITYAMMDTTNIPGSGTLNLQKYHEAPLTAIPGVEIVGSTYDKENPITSDIVTYYTNAGIGSLILSAHWESFDATLSGTLDSTAVGNYLTAAASFTKSSVILSPLLNYGKFVLADGTTYSIGDTTLTAGVFAAFWTNFAKAVKAKGLTNLKGYVLTGRPYGLVVPTGSTEGAVLATYYQKAIDAIRAIDTTSTIYIEGPNWSKARGSSTAFAPLASLTDSANKLVFTATAYADSTGTNIYWSDVANVSSYEQITADITEFSTWLTKNKLSGHIVAAMGHEYSATDASSDNWLKYGTMIADLATADNLEVSFWGDVLALGPSYAFSPRNTDSVLTYFIQAIQGATTSATSYTCVLDSSSSLTIPNDGSLKSPLLNLSIPGLLGRKTQFTFTSSGVKQFIPQISALNVPVTINYQDQIAIIPQTLIKSGDTYTVAVTNNRRLTDPAPFVFTVGKLPTPTALTAVGTKGGILVSIVEPTFYNHHITSYNIYVGTDATTRRPTKPAASAVAGSAGLVSVTADSSGAAFVDGTTYTVWVSSVTAVEEAFSSVTTTVTPQSTDMAGLVAKSTTTGGATTPHAANMLYTTPVSDIRLLIDPRTIFAAPTVNFYIGDFPANGTSSTAKTSASGAGVQFGATTLGSKMYTGAMWCDSAGALGGNGSTWQAWDYGSMTSNSPIINNETGPYWFRQVINTGTSAFTDKFGISFPATTYTYLYSTDGTTWTQLGQTVTSTASGFNQNVTEPLSVAVGDYGGFRIMKAIFMDSARVIANPDFTTVAVGKTTFNDTAPTPNTWTIGASSYIA